MVAGRLVPRIYATSGRRDIHEFVVEALRLSGGTVLFESTTNRVPIYVAVAAPSGERLGLMIYPFRFTSRVVRRRADNEVRGQLRYGGEESWRDGDHVIARDVAGVDTTLLLGVDVEAGVFVGLDPDLYDPLPLGISVYSTRELFATARESGWVVWERDTHAGVRRKKARAGEGLETLVAFTPNRLLDYALLQRRSTELGLDAALRFSAARGIDRLASTGSPRDGDHALEELFGLDAREILDIIASRMRLEVAVKGGVAEHHLEKQLTSDALVSQVTRLDADGQPDFEVTLADGRCVLVECKNASPELYANGDYKVEVQKTRATRDDPAGRLYRPEQFDVVAACIYSATSRWEFRFRQTRDLTRHAKHPDRLAALHRVDGTWHTSLPDALNAAGDA
ncbi:MAG: hypothetical protein HGA44_10905 [Cellulomonadaceae bacterium]|nr:hypothetical protein [Cellulomonadaceae bacterium]